MKLETVVREMMLFLCLLFLSACATQQPVIKESVAEPEIERPVEHKVVSETPVLKGYAVNFPFYVYRDRVSRENHYIPSGWMGDYGDIKLNENYTTNPYSGSSCIQIIYTAKRSQGAGWAGIYWQNPANNWGTVKGGYDLTGAKRVSFYARGEKGGELAEFKIGGIRGVYSDSDTATSGVVSLTKTWKKYTIPLEGLDLSYISGGFCWVTSSVDNPDGCTIYLDEIVYEK